MTTDPCFEYPWNKEWTIPCTPWQNNQQASSRSSTLRCFPEGVSNSSHSALGDCEPRLPPGNSSRNEGSLLAQQTQSQSSKTDNVQNLAGGKLGHIPPQCCLIMCFFLIFFLLSGAAPVLLPLLLLLLLLLPLLLLRTFKLPRPRKGSKKWTLQNDPPITTLGKLGVIGGGGSIFWIV